MSRTHIDTRARLIFAHHRLLDAATAEARLRESERQRQRNEEEQRQQQLAEERRQLASRAKTLLQGDSATLLSHDSPSLSSRWCGAERMTAHSRKQMNESQECECPMPSHHAPLSLLWSTVFLPFPGPHRCWEGSVAQYQRIHRSCNELGISAPLCTSR
jgi:hypothetical protein